MGSFPETYNDLWIIMCFWETANLPLPKANINTYFSLRAKCWLRGGVTINTKRKKKGGQESSLNPVSALALR